MDDIAQTEKELLALDAEETTLRNLREQLFSVQNIRYEHLRKDSLISTLKNRVFELERAQEAAKLKLSYLDQLEEKLKRYVNIEKQMEAVTKQLDLKAISHAQLERDIHDMQIKEKSHTQV
jgi:predicted RNase H-like nuclease (RuvC/YqgF family)